MTGNSNLRYSLSWACNVIRQLSAAHARATEITLKTLHLSESQLSILLACGRPEYYLIRESIRRLDRMLNLPRLDPRYPLDEQAISLYTTHLLSSLASRAKEKALKSFFDHLTALAVEQIMKKPVKRLDSES